MYDSIDRKCPQQANLQRQEVDAWLGVRIRDGGYRFPLGDDNVLILIVVVVVKLCKCAENVEFYSLNG